MLHGPGREELGQFSRSPGGGAPRGSGRAVWLTPRDMPPPDPLAAPSPSPSPQWGPGTEPGGAGIRTARTWGLSKVRPPTATQSEDARPSQRPSKSDAACGGADRPSEWRGAPCGDGPSACTATPCRAPAPPPVCPPSPDAERTERTERLPRRRLGAGPTSAGWSRLCGALCDRTQRGGKRFPLEI